VTRNEQRVFEAIKGLGGEGSGFQIHRKLVETSKLPPRWAPFFSMSFGSMYAALYRLETCRGLISSRAGPATCERGWRGSRIYTIHPVERPRKPEWGP